MAKELTGYELSRDWFDWSFSNPEKIKPIHTAIYFFAIEHRNRLGWKENFGLPTEMVKEAIGVKSWHTYIAAFNELVEWGFFILIERSKNQHSSNIIALSKNNKACNKALDKAIIKHASKQDQSTHQNIDSIDKPINNITTEPINHLIIIRGEKFLKPISEILKNEYRSVLDGHLSKSLKNFTEAEVLEQMDIEYPNYEFRDRNHLENSVKGIGEKILYRKKNIKTSASQSKTFTTAKELV